MCKSRPSCSRVQPQNISSSDSSENEQENEEPVNKRKCYRCTKCSFTCQNRAILTRHHASQHGGSRTRLQSFEENLDGESDGLRNEYNTFRSHILAPHRRSPNGAQYNYPTNNLTEGLSV